jgi:hypothetical protein
MKKIFLVISIMSLFFVACKSKGTKKDETNEAVSKDTSKTVAPPPDSSIETDSGKVAVLTQLTKDILVEIKMGNYSSLIKFIDPVSGVRFSPYGYIDTASDIVLTREKYLGKAANPKQGKMIWGVIDPSGEPINLTVDGYMKKFVYDVDFLNPEKFKVNEFIGGGNSLNNLLSVYKGSEFTESHFSGFEKKYEGMDWRSLRLVFKMRDGKYYLVGVIHSEWTI